MTENDKKSKSVPCISMVGCLAPWLRSLGWGESRGGVGTSLPHQVPASRCYGFSNSWFITLTFDRAKEEKIKSEMQWQLTHFSSLKDFVDLPEESWISTIWLLIGTAIWTLQNQIKYNLVYVILGLWRQGKIISLLQLMNNCLKDCGVISCREDFKCILNPDLFLCRTAE